MHKLVLNWNWQKLFAANIANSLVLHMGTGNMTAAVTIVYIILTFNLHNNKIYPPETNMYMYNKLTMPTSVTSSDTIRTTQDQCKHYYITDISLNTSQHTPILYLCLMSILMANKTDTYIN